MCGCPWQPEEGERSSAAGALQVVMSHTQWLLGSLQSSKHSEPLSISLAPNFKWQFFVWAWASERVVCVPWWARCGGWFGGAGSPLPLSGPRSLPPPPTAALHLFPSMDLQPHTTVTMVTQSAMSVGCTKAVHILWARTNRTFIYFYEFENSFFLTDWACWFDYAM